MWLFPDAINLGLKIDHERFCCENRRFHEIIYWASAIQFLR